MAIDAYMQFIPYKGDPLKGESQVDISKSSSDPLLKDFKSGALFEIEDYSFDIEQTLNIGSQSTGAGAGKVTFNPFSITRKIDRASPTLFQNACSGTPFKLVSLVLRKSAGGDTAGVGFLRYDFKLVAVKTISISHDDESPKENITFEYGGLVVRYSPQKPDGTMDALINTGWNRVKNISDADPAVVIS